LSQSKERTERIHSWQAKPTWAFGFSWKDT
jgi:hypothetical protein